MSSISVFELKNILEDYPDDYEVVMKIRTKYDVKAGESIAYINTVEPDEKYRELYLQNWYKI